MYYALKNIKSSIRVLLVFTFLTGVVYPLLVTGIATLVFPRQAGGSLIRLGGVVIGSELLAQKVTSPKYFQSRPSAVDYGTMPSGASNLSPGSLAFVTAYQERLAALGAGAPADLLTTSASGLDPHVSPEAATFQLARVAQARGLNNQQMMALQSLVASHTEGPQLGLLGRPRVNVLRLNISLDETFP